MQVLVCSCVELCMMLSVIFFDFIVWQIWSLVELAFESVLLENGNLDKLVWAK